MSAYGPVLIWLLSAVVCFLIAKARHLRPSFFWNAVVVLLGPLAIPLVFLARPQEPSSRH